MNVLLINGHEYWESSPGKLNKSLFEEAEKWHIAQNNNVKSTILENTYSLEDEVQKILWADVIIYFSPVYWMSITTKLKHYFDHVYAQGRGRIFSNDGRDNGGEYGTGGLLQSKSYMLVTTWNAPFEAFYGNKRFLFEGKKVDDVFLNFHAMQKFIGMKKLESFSLFDVKRNPNYKQFLIDFKYHLKINITEARINEDSELV